jgi:hypothetical protein
MIPQREILRVTAAAPALPPRAVYGLAIAEREGRAIVYTFCPTGCFHRLPGGSGPPGMLQRAADQIVRKDRADRWPGKIHLRLPGREEPACGATAPGTMSAPSDRFEILPKGEACSACSRILKAHKETEEHNQEPRRSP